MAERRREVVDKPLQRCSDQLVRLFANCFADAYQTQLRGGGDEPSYQPAENAGDYHLIVFTHDYFSSALHEVAHWCVAGERRRQCADYGYWYEPDGRDREKQLLFQQVEAKPQALEAIFSQACGLAFRPSMDNLGAGEHAQQRDELAFATAIADRVARYREQGLPKRAQIFCDALQSYYAGDSL